MVFRRAMALAAVWLGLCWPAFGLAGEQAGEQAGEPAAGRDEAAARWASLLPAQRLGARVRAMEHAWSALPVVVVVRDERSYVEAIGRWTPAVRYPVLLDDGRPASREAIARFVRAYRPERVVLWADREEPAGEGWSGPSRRSAVESALLRSWGVVPQEGQHPMAALVARGRALGAPPPGVVVVDEGDSAWTAGLALASARLQPMVWLDAPGGINQVMAGEQADAFCRTLESALDALGLGWSGLGDEVDAVTLCQNAPARVDDARAGVVALTARVGRLGSIDRTAPRWAWCGHVFGSSARSAADAMASIFLGCPSAWLFDAYPPSEPWSRYAMAPAGAIYEQLGLGVWVSPADGGGLAQWQAQAAEPIDAGLVAVNTKGRANEFYLRPGRACGRDVPMLARPAAAYVIHSFSAQRPGVDSSVAGAWRSRGVFAYIGSVDEPGLQSFVPQRTFAARLGSLFPFGAAGREDGLLENRKLAVLGDPLWMLQAGPRRRADGPLPLEGVRALDELAEQAIGRGALGEGAWLLRMAGRDEALVALAMETLGESPRRVDGGLALASLGALFEAQRRPAVAAMFARLDPGDKAQAWVEDLAWHALRPLLGEAASSVTIARLLSGHLRGPCLVADAQAVADALARAGQAGEALTVLRAVMGRARHDAERAALAEAIERLR